MRAIEKDNELPKNRVKDYARLALHHHPDYRLLGGGYL